MDLSLALPLGSGRQHAHAATAVASGTNHSRQSAQSIAEQRPSSSDSEIAEDIRPSVPVAIQPQPQAAPSTRRCRPLSSRPAVQMAAEHAAAAPSCPPLNLASSSGRSREQSARSLDSDSAEHVVNELGQAPGVLRQLHARLDTLDGPSAAALGKIIDTLGSAERQGVDITHFLVDILQQNGTAAAAESEAPANLRTPRESAGAGGAGRPKSTMRLPRGLEPRALTAKQASPEISADWRLRVLSGYDDAETIGLTGIELVDSAGKRCVALP